jgi:ubiquinone/menaquinone biosynthesis C-methylase UbiE
MKKADWELDLEEILPEYESKNFFVRKLFWSRLRIAEEMLRKRKKLSEKPSILDIGTGPAFLIRSLRKKYRDSIICGTDYNLNILKIKNRKDLDLIICDARNLSISDNSFDAIFLLDVLEHIPDLMKTMKELDRILKAKGVIIVSLPTETGIYKLGRLLLKGTTDQMDRPGGTHYHHANKVINVMKKYFVLDELRRIPLPWPFELFNIACFRKKKS